MIILDSLRPKLSSRVSADGRTACPKTDGREVDIDYCHACVDLVRVEMTNEQSRVVCRPYEAGDRWGNRVLVPMQ